MYMYIYIPLYIYVCICVYVYVNIYVVVSSEDMSRLQSTGAQFIAAALAGDLPAVHTFLTTHQVDVNSYDWDNTTALIAAAGKGHRDVVELSCSYIPIPVHT